MESPKAELNSVDSSLLPTVEYFFLSPHLAAFAGAFGDSNKLALNQTT